MSGVTYFVCGLRTTGAITIDIKLKNNLTAPTPQLLRIDKGGANETIDGKDGAWTVTLPNDDQILRLEGPDYKPEDWPGVDFTLSADAVQVTIRAANDRKAWPDKKGGSDPKDPWPPPGALIDLDAPTWFETTFAELRRTMALPRSL